MVTRECGCVGDKTTFAYVFKNKDEEVLSVGSGIELDMDIVGEKVWFYLESMHFAKMSR